MRHGFEVQDLIRCKSKVQVIFGTSTVMSFDPWHVTNPRAIRKRM